MDLVTQERAILLLAVYMYKKKCINTHLKNVCITCPILSHYHYYTYSFLCFLHYHPYIILHKEYAFIYFTIIICKDSHV